jgi:hypothetical protein
VTPFWFGSRSAGNHGVALGGMESDKEMSGLDTELFSRAPPEAMQATLEYVEWVPRITHAYTSVLVLKERTNC